MEETVKHRRILRRMSAAAATIPFLALTSGWERSQPVVAVVSNSRRHERLPQAQQLPRTAASMKFAPNVS